MTFFDESEFYNKSPDYFELSQTLEAVWKRALTEFARVDGSLASIVFGIFLRKYGVDEMDAATFGGQGDIKAAVGNTIDDVFTQYSRAILTELEIDEALRQKALTDFDQMMQSRKR